MVMLVNWFPKKACPPMKVTLLGMVTLVNWLYAKAPLPMEV
jgi:hypothetical protein